MSPKVNCKTAENIVAIFSTYAFAVALKQNALSADKLRTSQRVNEKDFTVVVAFFMNEFFNTKTEVDLWSPNVKDYVAALTTKQLKNSDIRCVCTFKSFILNISFSCAANSQLI